MHNPKPPEPTQTPAPASDSKDDPSLLAFQRYKPRPGFSPSDPIAPAPAKADEIIRGVVLPDTHVPLHDRLAWACALGIIREFRPHFGVIIGDFGEFESLSKHAKSKPDLVRLSEEFYDCNVALDELQGASPNTEWDFVEGNHEQRAVRFANEFGQLDGLFNVAEQLYILPQEGGYHRASSDLRGMGWIPHAAQPLKQYGCGFQHGDLPGMFCQYPARYYADVEGPQHGMRQFYFGHSHTFQYIRLANGYWGQCVGYLGPKNPTYRNGKAAPWVHGLVTLEVHRSPTLDIVQHTPIEIQNGRAVFGGRLYMPTEDEIAKLG